MNNFSIKNFVIKRKFTGTGTGMVTFKNVENLFVLQKQLAFEEYRYRYSFNRKL